MNYHDYGVDAEVALAARRRGSGARRCALDDVTHGYDATGRLYANANPLSYSDPTGLVVGVDDLAIGGLVVTTGCLMSSGCRDAIGNAMSSAANAAGSAASAAGSAASSAITAVKNFCSPDDQDPCKGLRNQIQEHERKLRECMANPMGADNKGFLAGALASGNQALYDKIYASRILSLQSQIANFKKLLEECERRNGR